ncbi:CAMK family protein kinase [Tritrichomonas foetus]|uniref:CAMK family protein kinase n=1 Tax=Tritrichomonas foetus TaxID=1144522 RepID=A0A1J4KUD3_9EUKA|nr:CAMK family protein kinase [Tritrichomonas foetus]|eukprot:OHT14889.1 CAMK family protein kinase [Tritrichomonas foetus]
MIDHPFIAHLYDIFEDSENLYIVLEYAGNGSCYNQLVQYGPFEENLARRVFCELLSAIDYLHNTLKIAHHDIKAENVLLDKNNHVKLIDFGFSREFDDTHPVFSRPNGSPEYSAPEIFKGHKNTGLSDVWSLGVVLHTILLKIMPFSDPDYKRLTQKILYTESKYLNMLPPMASDLIQKMLKKDPSQRISLEAIYKHMWVQKQPLLHSLNKDFGVPYLKDLPIDKDLVPPGVDPKELEKDLKNHKFTNDTIFYRMNKRKNVSIGVTKAYNEAVEKVVVPIMRLSHENIPKPSMSSPRSISPRAITSTTSTKTYTKTSSNDSINNTPNYSTNALTSNATNSNADAGKNNLQQQSKFVVPTRRLSTPNTQKINPGVDQGIPADPYFNVKRHRTGSFLDTMKK